MSTTDNLEVPHDEEYTIANGNERSHSVNSKRMSRIQLERIPGAIITETGDELQAFWDRLRGKGRTRVGVFRSIKNILLSSCKPPTRFLNSYISIISRPGLNILLVIIPVAWASHFVSVNDHEHAGRGWGHGTTFTLLFLALVPLEQLLDWGGEQMSMYLGKSLGDLLMITLNKLVIYLHSSGIVLILILGQRGRSDTCDHLIGQMRVSGDINS